MKVVEFNFGIFGRKKHFQRVLNRTLHKHNISDQDVVSVVPTTTELRSGRITRWAIIAREIPYVEPARP